ncbi:IS1182 family transposase [Thalassolituus oleivorans]|uniref:IS1182 family transposase n=2 Tax=Thalassolituus oleivorans TaxID=187493 RepID=UPI00042DC612|nr:IS1182 family transposase [Thalassolituus oleivorans]AHK14987.1 transposase IS4 [Thalassolituus oleivorans R6-15]AHK16289.1 transposase IS4 [Thalassolituus oleivorans R6-15]
MPKFKPYNYNQTSMVVINYQDQLQLGTFEHAIHYLIDQKLDLSIFNPNYKNDDGGRPAYDPAILLKIILFAYSKGITSSREIQWCCETNIIFKALSCDSVPHFTTIASFVSSYPKAIEELFEQILLICHQQGLLGNELFAIDGCKMPSNAAKEWSGTLKELEDKRDKLKRQIRRCLNEHKKFDKQDPDTVERQRRSQQTLDTLNKAFDKVDQFLKTATPRMGQGKRPKEVKSNITDNQSGKMTTSKGTIQGYNGVATVDRKHQIIIDAQAFGEGQEHHTLKPVLENIKDRYQRLGIRKDVYAGRYKVTVTADTGFANEQNMQYLHNNKIDAYIPDNQFRSRDPKFQDQKKKYGKRHQEKPKSERRNVIPATEFKFDPTAMTCYCPAGENLSFRGERLSESGQSKAFFEGRLLQCRYCDLKHECMENPEAANHRKGAGRQVSFTINDKRKPTFTDWMKHRVDSEHGKHIYSHRMSTVEPVFANIGTNKGLKRFGLRGKAKVQGQWQLYCMIHNIEKIMRYGELAR